MERGPREGKAETLQLTARGVGLLVGGLVAVIFCGYYDWPLGVGLGLLGLLLVPLAWVLARHHLRGLRLERKLPERCFAGEVIPVELAVTNTRRWMDAVGVEVEDALSGPSERGLAALWIPARGGTCSRCYTTRLIRRGRGLRARSLLTSTWPMGLWRNKLVLRERIEVIVFPHPARARRLALSFEEVAYEQLANGRPDRMGEFHGLRPFRPGDRLSQIHWPSSTRGREFLVRQYDQPEAESYCILFHSISQQAAGESNDGFEAALELLCGLLVECGERRVPVDFFAAFHGWERLRVGDRGELQVALGVLAGARRHGERDGSGMVQALLGLGRHTRVFVVSDAPVSQWQGCVPPMEAAVTCLSVSEMRQRPAGWGFKATRRM